MTERIFAVLLNDDLDAPRALRAPQPCEACEGEGRISVQVHLPGLSFISVHPCGVCRGAGYTVFMSWN